MMDAQELALMVSVGSLIGAVFGFIYSVPALCIFGLVFCLLFAWLADL